MSATEGEQHVASDKTAVRPFQWSRRQELPGLSLLLYKTSVRSTPPSLASASQPQASSSRKDRSEGARLLFAKSATDLLCPPNSVDGNR